MNRLFRISYIFLSVIVVFSCKETKTDKSFKIFRYNQDTDISSLDPAYANTQGNIWAVNQLFNGLVTLDKKLDVIPCLAERWKVSPDGKIYTFFLRKNVFFHDAEGFKNNNGREVTAQDFAYSFKRIIDPKTVSRGAWIFNDKVLKINDSTFSDTCFKAINKYMFQITLQKPYAPFLQILTMPYAYVVPQEIVEKWQKEFRIHPVGTGAFKFKIWEDKSALVFEKNKSYWKKDSLGNPLPYLDGIHISFVNDRNIAFMLFRQKKIDFISGLDENSRDIVFDADGHIQKDFSASFDVQKMPYMNTEYLGIQLDKSTYQNKKHPLLNLKVRQALNYSINRKQMVQYLLNNVGKAGENGAIPPFMLPSSSVKGFEYNIDKALQLLAEAGYPHGEGLPPIMLNTLTRFPYKEICEFAQREWSKIGIKIQIETLDKATLLENIASGNIKFFRASWQGDYADPENYMALFYSKNFTPTGPNKCRFSNPEFDIYYEKALSEQNKNIRKKYYHKMDSLAMTESPMVVLFYDEVVRLLQKNVVGLEADAMNNLFLETVNKK